MLSCMANNTLNDIIVKVSSIVSQEIDVVSDSDEYALWRAYVNMAQNEWGEVSEWSTLYTEYNANTTTTSQATIELPSNFRKLAGYPKVSGSQSTNEYQEIDPVRKGQYGVSDKYCYRFTQSGKDYLVIHPTDTFASGASIFVPYWRSLASLVSPTDVVECPNADYLVQRTVALVWESREDARFQQAKAEAEKILARMIEYDVAKGAGYDNTVQTPENAHYSFRIGRD